MYGGQFGARKWASAGVLGNDAANTNGDLIYPSWRSQAGYQTWPCLYQQHYHVKPFILAQLDMVEAFVVVYGPLFRIARVPYDGSKTTSYRLVFDLFFDGM